MIIDARIGGLGDSWMRLLALYTLSSFPGVGAHSLIVPLVLEPLARSLFSERFRVLAEGEGEISFTHLGLKQILPGVLSGRRYVLPYFRLLQAHRKQTHWKHHVNDACTLLLAATGRVRLHSASDLRLYQGFSEMRTLRPFSAVSWSKFTSCACEDLPVLGARLEAQVCGVKEPCEDVVVFPSGTAHQILPADWAARHLPKALFVFFQGDSYAEAYRKLGLRLRFYSNFLEMLAIGLQARRVLATDSFPSHFWQVIRRRVVLLMSQQVASQVVHPAFPKNQILHSHAPCCPCPSLDRTNHPVCAAGRVYCKTWDDEQILERLEELVK